MNVVRSRTTSTAPAMRSGHVEVTVADQQPQTVTDRGDDARAPGPAAQHGVGTDAVELEDVAQPAAQAAVARGQEPLGLPVDGVGGVDRGEGERQGLEPVDQPGGELVAAVDPAGGQVLLVDLVEQAVDGAADQAAPGQLVDADRDVEAGVVLGAGGVRGAGGQVHRQPGPQQHVVDAAVVGTCRRGTQGRSPRGWCTSHCLVPWVWKTKTSWVSLCTAKPCEPGGVR